MVEKFPIWNTVFTQLTNWKWPYEMKCYMALKSCCKNWKNAFSMTNICLPKYDCHQAIKYFDEKILFLQLEYAMFFF